jgi:hypothetical protein
VKRKNLQKLDQHQICATLRRIIVSCPSEVHLVAEEFTIGKVRKNRIRNNNFIIIPTNVIHFWTAKIFAHRSLSSEVNMYLSLQLHCSDTSKNPISSHARPEIDRKKSHDPPTNS